MIVDVHCHLALPARRVEPAVERFSFEPRGARGRPGFDAYLPTCLLSSWAWRFVGKRLGLDVRVGTGPALDAATEQVFERHLLDCPSVERVVLLAFDEYYTDAGAALGPIERRSRSGSGRVGSSLYCSNSLVQHFCRRHPDKFLFGASIHPYRPEALEALEEVRRHGAVLVKWLPLTQNIDSADERTQRFVRRAGELGIALLIHYGGEVTLSVPHPQQADPGPMLELLTELHRTAVMPPVMVAHAATPSYPWQRGTYFHQLVAAFRGPLRAAPLYADIAALYYRPHWLRLLLTNERYADVRQKLVFGSDFPVIPCTLLALRRLQRHRAYICEHPSWIERSYRIMRSLGADDALFTRAAEVLRLA